MTLLSVENVGFSYRSGKPVLEDISFTVPRGANVGLVGESGSGKSTLLRLLLGLDSPQKGRILFDGAPLEARSSGYMRSLSQTGAGGVSRPPTLRLILPIAFCASSRSLFARSRFPAIIDRWQQKPSRPSA